MPHSLARVLIHIVFSTKNREPWIGARLREPLFAYMGRVVGNQGCPALAIGGVADHVHVLLSLSRTVTIADIVEESKKTTSKWMKARGEVEFWWQAGYAAFSVSESHAARVMRYIARQEEHHHSESFQDEVRILLRHHRVEYDEQYLWD